MLQISALFCQGVSTIYRMVMEESRCEAVFPDTEVSVLTLEGKCLLFWAKVAHSSGHLLAAPQ
jgi:hypothetical protein